MSMLSRIKRKLKYSHPLRIFADGLNKFGIKLKIMILYEEPVPDPSLMQKLEMPGGAEISFWTKDEISEISHVDGRRIGAEELLERLESGSKCMGLKIDGKPAAFTWYRLGKGQWAIEDLEKDDAYLFDAYTLIAYRGKGIMPYLRGRLLLHLSSIGCKKLYSYSDYFNLPAIRFKEKLQAKRKHLMLLCKFWNPGMYFKVLKTY